MVRTVIYVFLVGVYRQCFYEPLAEMNCILTIFQTLLKVIPNRIFGIFTLDPTYMDTLSIIPSKELPVKFVVNHNVGVADEYGFHIVEVENIGRCECVHTAQWAGMDKFSS